jgi:exodeoxyribonuclease III
MRLITWNVNSLKARWPRVPELLEAHAPDVVCLQETKLAADAFPHAALAELGYSAVESSEGRWNGVALLVRDGLERRRSVRELPGSPVPEEARWIEATVDGVRIVSVYVPNGREVASEWYPRKLEFLAAMRDRLAGARRCRTDGGRRRLQRRARGPGRVGPRGVPRGLDARDRPGA